jgi:hypothetical protein
MSTVGAPIHIAGSELGQVRHICAFFHNREEEYRTLLPFIKDGFACGDRGFHVVDSELRNQHVERLEAHGVDVSQAEQSGQFKLYDWDDLYFKHGHFDQHRVIALLEQELQAGVRQGFRVSRSIGHMEWALQDRPGVEDLVEYEARLNYILPRYNDPIICVYDLSKFGGAVVMDILRTHPMVIIGGILQENPFFVPPEKFLREWREQREARTR